MIREGDSVYHKPSGETWYVLGVNQAKQRVCIAGYPPTEAYLPDCELVERGNGITETELKYRESRFGTDWDGEVEHG